MSSVEHAVLIAAVALATVAGAAAVGERLELAVLEPSRALQSVQGGQSTGCESGEHTECGERDE